MTPLDERPEIDADVFSYRELPDDGMIAQTIMADMVRTMRERGIEEMRVTIVSAEHPKPPYPHGIYLEGWIVAPHRMPVMSKAGPFSYPLTFDGRA